MKKIIIIIVIAAVGLIALIVRNNNQESLSESQVLGRAPEFSLRDFNGNTVSLADFSGKPRVINSWAVWCPFCREELKDFAAVQKEFGDEVVIIAIDRAEPISVQKNFTDEISVTSDLIFLSDPNDSFYASIGGFSMPETIFVDKDGNIRDHKRGPMKADEIRERIKKITN
ncbi:MAG: TlpA family protein disulfide reductase [Candidatus Doudnabacteria bacterium]|nr:TlpA family protein disulfide reductase [Candidatus Doudnabacteria bacterium]